MKRVLLAIAVLTMVAACDSQKKKEQTEEQQIDMQTAHIGEVPANSEARKLMDPLVAKYPNYSSNEIAAGEVCKELEQYIKSYIGKPFPLINDLEVRYEEIDKTKNGVTTVWFSDASFTSYGGDKWDFGLWLLVEMPKEEAAKMDRGSYFVKGTLKSWNKDGRYFGTGLCVSGHTIWLGTFVISDATITKI